jgi:hypothetical protein
MDSMENNPASEDEASRKSIAPLLWYSKTNYNIHKSLPLVPILSHMNPIHDPLLWDVPSYLRLGLLWGFLFPSASQVEGQQRR